MKLPHENIFKIKIKHSCDFTSFQIPTEFPLETENEEEEAQEKEAPTTGEGSKEKTSPPDTRPQLVDEKETSGCSLCRIL